EVVMGPPGGTRSEHTSPGFRRQPSEAGAQTDGQFGSLGPTELPRSLRPCHEAAAQYMARVTVARVGPVLWGDGTAPTSTLGALQACVFSACGLSSSRLRDVRCRRRARRRRVAERGLRSSEWSRAAMS